MTNSQALLEDVSKLSAIAVEIGLLDNKEFGLDYTALKTKYNDEAQRIHTKYGFNNATERIQAVWSAQGK